MLYLSGNICVISEGIAFSRPLPVSVSVLSAFMPDWRIESMASNPLQFILSKHFGFPGAIPTEKELLAFQSEMILGKERLRQMVVLAEGMSALVAEVLPPTLNKYAVEARVDDLEGLIKDFAVRLDLMDHSQKAHQQKHDSSRREKLAALLDIPPSLPVHVKRILKRAYEEEDLRKPLPEVNDFEFRALRGLGVESLFQIRRLIPAPPGNLVVAPPHEQAEQ